ncbi:MFS family permease [Actinoplanes couchii]|uniref:MFS transporter n=1 Tax=Actinoplanes couchii TaxID=403638 RepID=A0ABQ3XPR5_9ACTN|nr:MFS family permease [Actinoplanes couchii]GID60484.1 MFS transporter [Actinoplanes couchii]
MSETGSAVGYAALPIVAVLVLGVPDFQVSLLTVLAGLVSALLALPLGPWIEHHRKLPVMIAADLVRVVVVLSVAAAAWFGLLTYWQLCLVAVLQTVARMAFDAAGVAQLRTLVPADRRTATNGRFETALWTANTVGPPVGGLLISWLGATATMLLDAVSYAISALLLRGLDEPEPPPRPAERNRRRDLTAGWRHILAHPGLAALFGNSMIFGGCVLAASPLLTVLVLRDLRFPAWQYGLITGVAGLAGVAGSMLAAPLVQKWGGRRVLLLAGVGRNLWLGLVPPAPASTTGLVLIAAADFLLVFFAGVFGPVFATYRMDATGDAHLSRVVMAWSVSSRTVPPLFIAAAGVLATMAGARVALAVLAVVLLGGIALLPWRAEQGGVDRKS